MWKKAERRNPSMETEDGSISGEWLGSIKAQTRKLPVFISFSARCTACFVFVYFGKMKFLALYICINMQHISADIVYQGLLTDFCLIFHMLDLTLPALYHSSVNRGILSGVPICYLRFHFLRSHFSLQTAKLFLAQNCLHWLYHPVQYSLVLHSFFRFLWKVSLRNLLCSVRLWRKDSVTASS